jgi:biopolymer transport protein ExbD
MSYFDVNIERARKKPREISLVPMINVIFLMLIFFIVSGKIEHVHILPIDIPLSEQTSDVSLGEEVITLGKRDEILVGEAPIFTLDALEEWIAQRIKANPAVRFTIKADADMSATILIEVMHLMERAGAHDVVLAAQQP